MDALESLTGRLDSVEQESCWVLLNNGCGVSRIAAMVEAGTLFTTPYEMIPLTE